MISDVISDALDSIEQYQQEFAGSYTDFQEEIEQVKLAMARLLIRLDTPPEMTAERWAEEMTKVTEADPAGQKDLMRSLIYHVRREQVAEALGRDHPMVVRLLEAEQAVMDEESELAEALEAYTDPTHPEYDPEFDGRIRSLRPDWFEDGKRG